MGAQTRLNTDGYNDTGWTFFSPRFLKSFRYEDAWLRSEHVRAINPNPDGPAGLTLNIDEVDNSLNIDLVMSIAKDFQLRPPQARAVKDEVLGVVATWLTKAQKLELPANDIERMALAFQASRQR